MNDIFQQLHDALSAGETATVLKLAAKIDRLHTDRMMLKMPYPVITEEEINSAQKLDRKALNRREKQ